MHAVSGTTPLSARATYIFIFGSWNGKKKALKSSLLCKIKIANINKNAWTKNFCGLINKEWLENVRRVWWHTLGTKHLTPHTSTHQTHIPNRDPKIQLPFLFNPNYTSTIISWTRYLNNIIIYRAHLTGRPLKTMIQSNSVTPVESTN